MITIVISSDTAVNERPAKLSHPIILCSSNHLLLYSRTKLSKSYCFPDVCPYCVNKGRLGGYCVSMLSLHNYRGVQTGCYLLEALCRTCHLNTFWLGLKSVYITDKKFVQRMSFYWLFEELYTSWIYTTPLLWSYPV